MAKRICVSLFFQVPSWPFTTRHSSSAQPLPATDDPADDSQTYSWLLHRNYLTFSVERTSPRRDEHRRHPSPHPDNLNPTTFDEQTRNTDLISHEELGQETWIRLCGSYGIHDTVATHSEHVPVSLVLLYSVRRTAFRFCMRGRTWLLIPHPWFSSGTQQQKQLQ